MELLARLGDRRLDDASVERLAEHALAHQADRSQPWIRQWGEFVEAGRNSGRIKEPQWQRYVAQADDCYELEVRKVVRVGQPVPIRVVMLEQRTAAHRVPGFSANERYWFFDNVGCPWGLRSERRSGQIAFEGLGDLPPAYFHAFKPGPHEVRLSSRTSEFVYGRASSRMIKTVELVSDDKPRVKLRFDPAQAETVEKSLSVIAAAPADAATIQVTITASTPAVNLAFDGRLFVGPDESDLGWIVFPAGRVSQATVTVAYRGSRDGTGRVDVVLKPSTLAAEQTVDFEQIWGGEVAWRDVPVGR
jgi:hypothetical protein